MEQPIPQFILDLVKTISLPGVAALAVLVVLRPLMPTINDWLKQKVARQSVTDSHKKAIESVGRDVQLIGANHLHEVKDLLIDIRDGQNRLQQSIDRAVDNNVRVQGEIKESITYIRARMNGRN